MPELVIRPAAPGDVDAVAALHVLAWRRAYDGLLPADVLAGLSAEERAVSLRARLQNPVEHTRIEVADRDGTVLGFTNYGAYRVDVDGGGQRPEPAEGGEIRAIYVHPDHWGVGAGHALMESAIAGLHALGLSPVRLWVLESNEQARRFYEAHGMRPDGERAMYTAGSEQVPEIRYILE